MRNYLRVAIVFLFVLCLTSCLSTSYEESLSAFESQEDSGSLDSSVARAGESGGGHSAQGSNPDEIMGGADSAESVLQDSLENSEFSDRILNATLEDLQTGEVSYDDLPSREMDYLEMSIEGGEPPIQAVRVGDEVMGFRVSSVAHTEAFVENNWHDVRLSVHLEGPVSLEGILHYGSMVSFVEIDSSFDKIPKLVIDGDPNINDNGIMLTENDIWKALQAEYGSMTDENTQQIDGVVITFSTIVRSYRVPSYYAGMGGEILEIADSEGKVLYLAENVN